MLGHAKRFRNLPPSRLHSLLCAASSGAARNIFDARTEGRSERYDRHWRRWCSFCDYYLDGEDPSLARVPDDKRRFVLRAYTKSPNLIRQDKLLESIGLGWRAKLSAKPSARWLRHTSTVLGKVPFTNREIVLEDCSLN